MTQWQSMFDAGACVVSVSNSNSMSPNPSSPWWSGVLDKGQSSPTFSIPVGVTGQVSVDGNGVVTLAASVSGVTAELDVFPQYDVSTLQTQITGISAPGFNSPSADAYDDKGASQAPPDFVVLSIATSGTSTPSSATFPAHASASPPGAFVGVIVGYVG